LNGVAALYKARQLAERGVIPSDEAFAKAYPSLFSLLTNSAIDERRSVDGTSLRVSNSAGDWCLTLAVPALGAYAEVLSKTWNDGLAKLDSALSSGSIEWRFNLRRSARIRKQQEEKKSP
jgi:hypothetical protein